MKNKNYSLVLLHHEEVFETRELALNYLTDYYKPNSLDGEPVIVKYGDEAKPNVILGFGTSDNAPGSYYAIDMAKANEQIEFLNETISGDKDELEYVAELLEGIVNSTGLTLDENKIENKISYEPDQNDEVIKTAVTIAEAIDLLSKYAQQNFTSNELSVEDTKGIRLIYLVNPDGGKILKAEINISTNDTDDVNFNNNIIGLKNDGIYAASHLAYDDVRHEIIFTTSGYKNGRFQDDAIVQKINLGQHTKLLSDNEGNTVKLVITEDAENYTATLSANLQIANRQNNILEESDGKVFVEGVARNIKYGDTTVANTLTELVNKTNTLETSVESAAKAAHVEGGQTDTIETFTSTLADGGAKVTGNVRLGSNNSIVVRNGGLEANITVDVDTTTNKLIVTIGNQTITKTLPGVELFKSAEYNDENEELIITFRTGNTLVIPIHNIIHTWQTRNDENSPIVLTKTVVTGGVDTLSGVIKIRSTDNLLGVSNGQLYVSEQTIDNKVAIETSRATNAENEIRTTIENLNNTINTEFESVSDEIENVKTHLTEETARAIAAENTINGIAQHADEIASEAKTNVTELTSQVTSLSNDLTSLEGNVETLSNNLTEAKTNINGLRNDLNTEITTRTNKDTELDGKITNLNTNLTSETSRAETAENTLDGKIDTLEQNILLRIAHDITDVQHLISDETTRATAAEEANATRIEEVAELIGDGSAETLAQANAYTDNKVLEEQNARIAKDTEIENSIVTAVRNASDDASAKANTAKTEAMAYTDTKVSQEKTRAEAAEEANANAISDLTTEVNKKIESVEIVKNSQSDLQYILKVDGQDISEINIPKDQFLSSVSYNPSTKEMTFVFETKTGTSTTVINVEDLVDTYTAGNGLILENNKFSVRINEDSEAYLTVSEEGVKLLGIDAALAQKANNSDLTELSDKIDIINGNESTVGSIKNALKVAKEYTDSNVTVLETENALLRQDLNSEISARESADNLKVDKTTYESFVSQINDQIGGIGQDFSSLETLINTKADSNNVYTKAESDEKYITEHQDISNLATKAELSENTSEIEELSQTVDDMKFITEESDTVRMSMIKETGAETRVLSSEVKIKTISGSENTNIIKSDGNGIYATVSLNYNKATNKITFNDGNGDKEFELNNFGILQDAFYESATQNIVLIIKKDDSTTERIEIPVSDLVNTWDVQNTANSPIILTKTSGEENEILTADLSILENEHNLLINENGSLFVDDDANTHFALWGATQTTVQGALNLIKQQTDKIDTIESNITNITNNLSDIDDDVEDLRSDLSELQTQVNINTQNISNIEGDVTTIQRQISDFESRLEEVEHEVDELKQQLGDISGDKTVAERLADIEEALRKLIDFGTY